MQINLAADPGLLPEGAELPPTPVCYLKEQSLHQPWSVT